MQTTQTLLEQALVVEVTGRIDSITSPALEQSLAGLPAAAGSRPVVVDLAGVDYISSAGLRVMLGLAKRARAHPPGLRLCGLAGPVRQVFELAGFLPLFTIEASRDAALARAPGA